ncbi:nucleotidyltransferase domain-containing protein [Lentzea sp. BCCO 10_0856]|uniref:Nucleotidyltransferase domain-containing protein n=1 Tax=Lentzea miocenica TaxID=3095431 RepID=A0ABU4T2V1_9PSEU|nr:nucleotidyltransferase domain-containing protein [Lentzea sp. BCCO 10_0856]MDX8032471.1 nucleotidyltransferase domain-containing protein [Lentzea sp. BCCO 10_0856]
MRVHEIVAANLAEIEDLCRALGVRRLDVFGSAVGDSFDVATSDVDILVDFEVGNDFDHFGTYFALKEGLERILGRPVDLVVSTSIRNPYFRQQVMETKETLYAA